MSSNQLVGTSTLPIRDYLFDITTETPLVIYACSDWNSTLVDSLRTAGYNPVAFFDRRASEIGIFANLPVYTAEDAPFTEDEKKRLTVLICMQNIIQHEAVAELLTRLGYHRKLGLLPPNMLPTGAQSHVYDLYNQLLIGNYRKLKGIPESHFKQFENIQFTSKDTELDVIWVPASQCYTISRSDFVSYHPDAPHWQIDRLAITFDRTIINLPLYDELFEWLETGNETIESYLDVFAGDNKQIRETLKLDRLKLYNRFCEELDKGLSFFEHSPATAKLDSQGRYIIIDGLHRCIFLIRKGYDRIPLLKIRLTKISEELKNGITA